MTTTSAVRAARLALARALTEAPGGGARELDEAERQLRAALQDAELSPEDPVATDGPAGWEVLSALADLARSRDRRSQAFGWLVRAVTSAPVGTEGALAEKALQLLEEDSSSAVAEDLPAPVADALWEAARDQRRDDVVVRLAARLALARGQVGVAGDMTRQRVSVGSPGDDEDLRAAEVASEVVDLLADGDDDQAELRLAGVRSEQAYPALTLAEALLHYARGRPDEALSRSANDTATGDLAAVPVLALLRLAANGSDARDDLLADAKSAAARMARGDPAGAAPVLLRSQVLLEGGREIELGRELLGTALKRLGGPPDDIPWWRIQERSRHDPYYDYFRIEVAAALDRRQEVVDRTARYDPSQTTYAQDARVSEIAADFADSPSEAAQHLRAAATAHRLADDRFSSVRCLREAVHLADDPAAVMDLVEALWSLSFVAQADVDSESLVAEGLDVMAAYEGHHAEEDLATACLMWGLLLSRRDAVTPDPGPPAMCWRPIPHLLLATLLDPQASYSWGHLAWACVEADLRWPAAWAASQAVQLLAEDDWLREALVVSQVNWSGELDDDLRKWLATGPKKAAEPGWVAVVEGLELLFAERPKEAAALVPSMDLDAAWAREIRVNAIVLGDSLEASKRELRTLADDVRKSGPPLDAAWLQLLLDPRAALDVVETATQESEASAAQLQELRALIDLVTSDGEIGGDRVQRALSRTARPYRILDDVHLRFPMLLAAHPNLAGLRATLSRLRQVALDLLASMDFSPRLDAEIDAGDIWCADANLATVVQQLLAVADHAQPEPALADAPELPGERTLHEAWACLVRTRTV
jgi:hypothetical protein